jgi:dTDP-4-dehydrorhamnose reductase
LTRRVLITGGAGQVGRALRALPWPEDIQLVVPARAELDLGDAPLLRRWLVGAGRLDGILSVGAYTAVDRAESERAQAWAVNAVAPFLLADAARAMDAPLIHVSTDYVFDGQKDAPYVETDIVAPLGVYGASKAAGEIAVAASGSRHVIVRTSWVVSATGNNFVRTMLRLATERPVVGVVADQHGAPTGADDLARALQHVLLAHLDDRARPGGVIHAANAGETTWHGVAAEIFAALGRNGRQPPRLDAISTAEYPTPARRPANSRLDTSLLAARYGVTLRPWRDAVADIVARLLLENAGGQGGP